MPLTPFVRLPGGEPLSHLGLPQVELLLQLLPWENPRLFDGKRLGQQVEAQCAPVSRSSVWCSPLDKEYPGVWVERSV